MKVRHFLQKRLPIEMSRRGLTQSHPSREDYLGWARILSEQGWSVPGWDKAHGGCGWTPRQRQMFEEEAAMAGAPPFHIQSVFLAGPLIAEFGTPAQKAELLPAIREGRELWAQGFSEPGAGSDLASLQTRAARDGDHWIVNGQKIWTSDAYMCDWIFCLVRTDPSAKAQSSISMLLFRLDLPGITVRPIPLVDGGASLCEVFFQDVRVPLDALLGAEGQGWTYAKYLLGNERTTTAEVPRNKREIARLKAILAEGSAPIDAVTRHRLAALEIDLIALEKGVETALATPYAPDQLLPSVLKLQGTELMQATLEMAQEVLGPRGTIAYASEPERPWNAAREAEGVVAEFLFRRAATIYGGSSEIQLGIIAKTLLRADENGGDAGLSDEEAMLADSLRGFLAREHNFQQRQAMIANADRRRALWRAIAQQGWLGVTLRDEEGGFGGTTRDGSLVAQAMGRALVTLPFAGNLLAGRALAGSGARLDLLQRWIAGETMLSLAHHDSAETRGVRTAEGGLRISGAKTAVLGADMADHWIVAARTRGNGDRDDGVTLVLVPRTAPGLTVRVHRTIDDGSFADLLFDDVVVGAEAVLGPLHESRETLEDALAHGLLDACAEMVGAMDRAIWLTRDYLTVRQQFGQPLAGFQTLQHRLARMYMELERSRAMLARAVDALDETGPARDAILSAAAARIGKSGFYVVAQAVQLHGGIALTEEYPIGHYFKRVRVLENLFGTPQEHMRRFTILTDAATGTPEDRADAA